MNALSPMQVLVQAHPTQAPLGPSRAGARRWAVCRDELTHPDDEDAFEGFVDGAGI
jgi:hypothetical protein